MGSDLVTHHTDKRLYILIFSPLRNPWLNYHPSKLVLHMHSAHNQRLGLERRIKKVFSGKIIFMETIKGKIQFPVTHLLTVPKVSCSRCFQINDPVNHQFMLIAQAVAGTLSNDPNQYS